jgi:putative ABC transport system permease protein
MPAIYAILGILITVGVIYNAARIQLAERAHELASLRVLGFGRGEVAYVLVGEIMLLSLRRCRSAGSRATASRR